MVFKEETINVEHSPPKKVDVSKIETELKRLWSETINVQGNRRALAHTLTLVIFCERDEPSNELGQLVGQIIMHNPARAIVIRPDANTAKNEIQAFISTHCLSRGEGDMQLCCEQIWLVAGGEAAQELHSTILGLRLGDLPLVVWWRGQPDLEDHLFSELIKRADQIILDSTQFTAHAEKVNRFIARLRRDYGEVSFGDINWARIAPWREYVAQFFDAPQHFEYLHALSSLTIDYALGERANPSQAILLMTWLSILLDWRVVAGSYRRDGPNRSMRLTQNNHEVRVEIRGRSSPTALPGSLVNVSMTAAGEEPASFSISSSEDIANSRVQIGDKVTERSFGFDVPDEVSLVSSEILAPQHDRMYHRALEFLEGVFAE